MRSILALLLLAASTTQAFADFDDSDNPFYATDTIRFLIAKSTLVVEGTIDGYPIIAGGGPIYEPGVLKTEPLDCLSKITVERVLYGQDPAKKELWVHIYRVRAQNGVTGSAIVPKQRYILFLKPELQSKASVGGEQVDWRTSDIWFGAYPFDTELAKEFPRSTQHLRSLTSYQRTPGLPALR